MKTASWNPGFPRALRFALAALLAAAVAVILPASPAAAAVPAAIPSPNAYGITSTWHTVDLTGDGAADVGQAEMTTQQIYQGSGNLHPTIRVRVWFPAGYQPTGTPVPVLYLLHGGNGTYKDFTDTGGGNLLATLTGTGFNGIIVMPEGGRAGWYQDWAAETRGGYRPAWETFHIRQLIPWIDANFNTVKDGSGRYIAGISMGGYGALKYAVRHRDLFSRIGSLSGGTTIIPENAMTTIDNSLVTLGSSIENLGYPVIDAANWWNHQLPATWKEERLPLVFGPTSGWAEYSPQERVPEYRQYSGKLWIYAGTGESDILGWANDFHASLNGQSPVISHQYCRGTGGHDWTQFRTELTHFLSSVHRTSFIACPSGWTQVN